jgi:hypothetical protein
MNTEKEREREREKERNRETEKQRNRETEKQRNRETERSSVKKLPFFIFGNFGINYWQIDVDIIVSSE